MEEVDGARGAVGWEELSFGCEMGGDGIDEFSGGEFFELSVNLVDGFLEGLALRFFFFRREVEVLIEGDELFVELIALVLKLEFLVLIIWDVFIGPIGSVDVGKDGLESIVVFHLDGVSFVVVAGCTLNGC